MVGFLVRVSVLSTLSTCSLQGIEYVLFATLKELNCKRVAESLGRGGDGHGRCFG